MRFLSKTFYGALSALICSIGSVHAVPAAPAAASMISLPIGVIDFKACVEKSRTGKQEQTSFEEMKKKMDLSLQEKQKLLQEINAKLNDEDYTDSLSNEALAELKHKFRMMGQELAQQEEQCYQLLGQHNAQAIQKLQSLVEKAAEMVAKQEGLLMIQNREACFYYAPQLDKTDLVVSQLDKLAAAT
jgi:outer membrane protein